MAARDERDIDRDENATAPTAPGDILGISHVPTDGEPEARRRREGESGAAEDEGRVTPLEDAVDLGARDVTKNGRGETGPETGGHGSTPQRSGSTGMDIGG